MTATFQTFENRGGPEHTKERIEALRADLAKKRLDGFILQRGDEHMNEYVTAHDERLLWLTGFSGSAGIAIIMSDKAALFIDGRYTLQVQNEIDTKLINPLSIVTNRPSLWLRNNVKKSMRIGVDPNLISVSAFEVFNLALEGEGAKLVPLAANPIDKLWQDQPDRPENPVIAQPKKYAGEETEAKIKRVQDILKDQGVDAFVITAPESACWLFNIRGSDVRHTPIMLAHAIIHARAKPELFLNSERLNARAESTLSSSVKIQKPENFTSALKALGSKFKKVLIDPDRTNSAIYQTLRAARADILRGQDPIALPKACKNKAEIDGMRAAHLRDAEAMCRFLHWLETTAENDDVTEIHAARTLENFRRESGALKDISFETISGAGPNGAIVHYRVSDATDRKLKKGELFLIDSGAQYQDGTTDITRTVIIGEPTKIMARHYTLVLKAHINLATASFPHGTRGADLDPLARAPLWQAGLDYNHGTGHGIGSFLSVHEGPQGISRRAMVEFEPGMILSNEPGYYREGAYGIRLENLVLVTSAQEIKGGEHPMMSFETLTLVPFAKDLIDQTLLTKAELNWLNEYHQKVWKTVGKQLTGKAKSWLKDATRLIK